MPARNNRGVFTIWDLTRTAVAMEQMSKHVSTKTNTRNNRRAVFSLRSVPRGYKKDKEDRLSQSSFEMPACQDVSLGAEKSRDGIELRNCGIRVTECGSVEMKVWLWREDFTCALVSRYLECVIQWDCYSSCVKILCKETAVTDWGH
jgi:hypothetical protein